MFRMSSADRLASIIERIEALSRRMEDHLLDPFVDPEIKTRMAHQHAHWRALLAANMAAMEWMSELLPDWRELLAANLAEMERMTALLRRLDPEMPPPDAARAGDGPQS
jgi:ferric-dicitrate binding protein FerR (iron transport regulator)